MEIINVFCTILLIFAVTVPQINSDEIATRNEGSVKPPLVVNPIEHLTLDQDNGPQPERSLTREKRQNNKQPVKKSNNVEKQKPSPDFNPLEDLILNQDKNGFKPGASLSRVKRQYSDSESNSIESDEDISGTSLRIADSYEDDDEGRYPYPYPYPIPIFIGGGFGGFGGRGFGGRGFGGGFGGRGFGGRGFGGGFGGRGFGGGFGGRGVGGGFGGGRGGGGGRG